MSGRLWSFHWREARERLLEVAATWPLRPHGPFGFAADGVFVTTPRVLPPVEEDDTLDGWAARLPDALGTEFVILLQAGAMALGLWRDDELIDHVARKRYVVRGVGRAQPTHLRTRGKSRYGSRLRLQNHRLLLDDTIERLRDWRAMEGEPAVIHYSAPPRIWDEFLARGAALSFTRDDARLRRIGMDVDVPDYAELLRVRRALVTGSIRIP